MGCKRDVICLWIISLYPVSVRLFNIDGTRAHEYGLVFKGIYLYINECRRMISDACTTCVSIYSAFTWDRKRNDKTTSAWRPRSAPARYSVDRTRDTKIIKMKKLRRVLLSTPVNQVHEWRDGRINGRAQCLSRGNENTAQRGAPSKNNVGRPRGQLVHDYREN